MRDLVNKIILLFFFSISLNFLVLPFFAQAVTSTDSINVGLTIPPPSGGGGESGGLPSTDNPPAISSIVSTPSTTSVVITWTVTDDNSVPTISFNYDTNSTTLNNSHPVSLSPPSSYSTTLIGLSSAQLYYYKITAVDSIGQTTSSTGSFTTVSLIDTTPPIISNIVVTSTPTTATITWTTNENADSQVKYGLTSVYGTTLSNLTLVTSHSVAVTTLIPNTLYHFQIITTDAAGNATASADNTFLTTASAVPPPDVSNLQLAVGTNNMSLSWINPTVPDLSGVKVIRTINAPATSIADGSVLYDGMAISFVDNTTVAGINYFYTVFSYNTSNLYSGGTYKSATIVIPQVYEICGNGVDDDNNSLTDCADSACSTFPACLMITPSSTPSTTTPPINITAGGSTTTIYTPPTITVPSFARLGLSDLRFFANNRQVELVPNNTAVSALPGIGFTIIVSASRLASTPTAFVAKINGTEIHQFALSGDKIVYATDFAFPTIGTHQVNVEVTYENNEQDHIDVYLNSRPYGVVASNGVALTGATVSLYSGSGALYDVGRFGLTNPMQTNSNGSYGWVIPNGRYYLIASLDKYSTRQTPVFTISGNIINGPLELLPMLNFEDLSLKNIVGDTKILTQIGLQKFSDTATVVEEIKSSPAVQKTVNTVVASTIVGVVAVGTISLALWANLLSLLQLFFQPLLLLGRRRLVGWGQVYNSLNKLPIDLATVRLLNAETNQVIQSKVTDAKGRYAFMVGTGTYILQVYKNNFIFPSKNLLNIKEDGQRGEIYHGERIVINNEDAVIAANIPLDPVGERDKPVRIFWQQLARHLKIGLSWFGLLVTIISLYIAPRWYMWILLCVHMIFLAIFYRLSIPAKIKSWGTVYDNLSKVPVGRVVARLFNAQFNKLVAAQITDRQGRYYFLAGDNEYFVTYDHPSYQSEKTNLINLKGKDAENIAVDIALKKKEGEQLLNQNPS
jgi:hypothetical protein